MLGGDFNNSIIMIGGDFNVGDIDWENYVINPNMAVVYKTLWLNPLQYDWYIEKRFWGFKQTNKI